jgi:hypothetical protein
MPPEYKYGFMPEGRMKALQMASSRFSDLRKRLSRSGVIDPAIIEEMRVLDLLLTRAASALAGSAEDIQTLEKLLGPNLGETYR